MVNPRLLVYCRINIDLEYGLYNETFGCAESYCIDNRRHCDVFSENKSLLGRYSSLTLRLCNKI